MKAKISTASAWTEQEKLQVLFSIVDSHKPIDWEKVVIPEGRSKKAVKCMLDSMKRQAYGGTSKAMPSPGKSPTSKENGTKRKRTTKKDQEQETVDDDDEGEVLVANKKYKVESQDDGANAVVKTEAGDVETGEENGMETDEEDAEEA